MVGMHAIGHDGPGPAVPAGRAGDSLARPPAGLGPADLPAKTPVGSVTPVHTVTAVSVPPYFPQSISSIL
jgi:hypothetical protein